MVCPSLKQNSRRGDTLVEVMFAITIFALIAVLSINLMNSGVSTAQTALEVTMARNEIDGQAEALRFIQNSYLAEKELKEDSKQFTRLWDTMISRYARNPSEVEDLVKNFSSINRCSDIYDRPQDMAYYGYFVLNTRLIQPESFALFEKPEGEGNYKELIDSIIVTATDSMDTSKFQNPPLYPRIIYSQWGSAGGTNEEEMRETSLYRAIERVEGLWVIAVRGGGDRGFSKPEFYDFYIRTCWHAPGRNVPSTIGTIVRLYNPEVID